MLIGHFTEQPWQDDSSGLMGTQSTDLSISNEYYNPQVGSRLYNRYLDEKVYAEEMGYDAVLLNSAIAGAGNPGEMALAFKYAVAAGRAAYLAQAMPEKDVAAPSTPTMGMPFWQQ